MSFSAQRSRSFLGPLLGHTTTFMVDGRDADLAFAKSVLFHLAGDQLPCVVLDIDALYSSNSDVIFTPLPEAQQAQILVPEPDSDVEDVIPGLLASGSGKTIIVDSLNSLYHLLSAAGRSSRSRKLSFIMACLSYMAKAEGKAVLFTMYRRERASHFGRGGNISDMSDLTVSVSVNDVGLGLKCERGSGWSGGSLSLPIP